MHEVLIVCDGACSKNGTSEARAAAAALLECNGRRKLVGEYLGRATNQQAEIVAAALGLERLKCACRVTVVTDSQYVVKTMNGGFARKTNFDCWRRLDAAAARHQVVWKWTRGHAGHPAQEVCDKAARRIAKNGVPDESYFTELLGSLEGGIVRLAGDATHPRSQKPVIVPHIVNTFGAWGAGFVLAVSRRWPHVEAAYRDWAKRRIALPFELGCTQFVPTENGVTVANMLAQQGLCSPSNPVPLRYDALEACLFAVAELAVELGAEVHMPKVGCGLARGDWSRVEAIITATLVVQGIPVFVYEPPADSGGKR